MEVESPKYSKHRKRRIKTRLKIFQKYNHRCAECGSTDNLTIDHIRPKSLGGSDGLYNLQILCESCNQLKADKFPSVEAHSTQLQKKIEQIFRHSKYNLRSLRVNMDKKLESIHQHA